MRHLKFLPDVMRQASLPLPCVNLSLRHVSPSAQSVPRQHCWPIDYWLLTFWVWPLTFVLTVDFLHWLFRLTVGFLCWLFKVDHINFFFQPRCFLLSFSSWFHFCYLFLHILSLNGLNWDLSPHSCYFGWSKLFCLVSIYAQLYQRSKTMVLCHWWDEEANQGLLWGWRCFHDLSD